MRPLRLASYNIEWMNALFDDEGRLLNDDQPSARHGVSRARQIAALGTVFRAMDADGIMVIEAPDQGSRRQTVRALEGFARHLGLRTNRAVHGYASDSEQEIAFLFDPERLSVGHDPQGDHDPYGAPRFDATRRTDLNDDGVYEVIRLSKPPLELAVRFGGHDLRLIGVHAKSKAPHGARTDGEAVAMSIENRRKQLAECQWVRARADALLAMGQDLVVMGDLNDGPGLDEFERLFGKSGVEVVLGRDSAPDLHLHDPHALNLTGREETSARFWLKSLDGHFEALLDFIMVSPRLIGGAQWRIWHPLRDGGLADQPNLAAALLDASDHFPVTCIIDGLN